MPAEPSPTDILEHVRRVYTTCRTYRDTGEVRTVHPEAGLETRVRFETAFLRPAHFRFLLKCTAVGPRAERLTRFVLRNAEGVRSDGGVFDDVHAPLGLAAGPSRGASTMVPFLLLAAPSGHLPGPGLRLRGSEGTTWVLEEEGPGPASTTWWIERESFLLLRRRRVIRSHRVQRRLRRELRGPIGPRTRERFEQTLAAARHGAPLSVDDVTWEPVLDEPIENEAFTPPRD